MFQIQFKNPLKTKKQTNPDTKFTEKYSEAHLKCPAALSVFLLEGRHTAQGNNAHMFNIFSLMWQQWKKKLKHIQMPADHPIRSWLIARHVLTFTSAI